VKFDYFGLLVVSEPLPVEEEEVEVSPLFLCFLWCFLPVVEPWSVLELPDWSELAPVVELDPLCELMLPVLPELLWLAGPAPLFCEPAVAGCWLSVPLVLPACAIAKGDSDMASATASSLFIEKLSSLIFEFATISEMPCPTDEMFAGRDNRSAKVTLARGT
jgi:hypothetical protein